MRKYILAAIALLGLAPELFALPVKGHRRSQPVPVFSVQTRQSKHWVDSMFRTLSRPQRIAQLMIIRAHSNLGQDHINDVTKLIKDFNVGGLCFFQGGPVRQASLTNYYQSIAKTPLMICIDGEWGLGMRLDSVINYPRQLMMGAVTDEALIYQFGKAVGEQCKRIGVQVNYAPDIDINNNANNPVINDRSFGEDREKVAQYGIAYMKGMQDLGVMACAKHFPGHGDVTVDSHLDLPVINKTREQLDSLELYPFRALIKAGVGSMMIAHLYIPSIDSTANQATSLSKKNVTGLLRDELGYRGITFTDALEMQGVKKFYPAGEASVQSLIAGNDMLCLPGDVPGSIDKVLAAIREKRLRWKDINARVKKVLLAKYNLGLARWQPVSTDQVAADLNEQTKRITTLLARESLTLLHRDHAPVLPMARGKKIAYVAIGINKDNAFELGLKNDYQADGFFFDYKGSAEDARQLAARIAEQHYGAVVIALHNYSRRPANNFGWTATATDLVKQLQSGGPTISFVFGNPYAIRNICTAPNIVACYEDDDITQGAAADLLSGKITARGTLPVTVCEGLSFGTGDIAYHPWFPEVAPESVGMSGLALSKIDSIANTDIEKGAMPGCVVFAARNGKVVYNKAFGYTDFDKKQPITNDMIYDLASVTKVSATTVSVMKLYEEGKIDLNKTLGDYLPWTRGTDKAPLRLTDVLLHQAGLVPFIPFYREVIDTATGIPKPGFFVSVPDAGHQLRTAEGMYLRNDWQDTLNKRILQSKLSAPGKYVYSDNDFIFLGRIVEAVSGMPLNDYARINFYEPLRMSSTGFRPRERMPLDRIVPTEDEKFFRRQFLHGDVHDEGSAMFGEVAGHAGLFSDAYDLAQLYQMLLNGGEMNGHRYLKTETVNKFTAYNSDISRRGLGFDKPEKDNATRKEPYPSASASPLTFGHTGFTGTCVWVDPKYGIVYIFLSNRVTPTRNNNKISQLNVRPNIQEAIYHAITDGTPGGR